MVQFGLISGRKPFQKESNRYEHKGRQTYQGVLGMIWMDPHVYNNSEFQFYEFLWMNELENFIIDNMPNFLSNVLIIVF